MLRLRGMVAAAIRLQAEAALGRAPHPVVLEGGAAALRGVDAGGACGGNRRAGGGGGGQAAEAAEEAAEAAAEEEERLLSCI